MTRRFGKEWLLLYLTITIVYIIHWMHNDSSNSSISFVTSLLRNFWQVLFVVGINFLYFELVLPYVTSEKKHRLLLIVSSILIHLVVFTFGLYGWRLVGSFVGIYRSFKQYTGVSDIFTGLFVFTIGTFLLFAVFKLFFDYTQLKYEGQQANLEKKQAELAFLKSQINPHFLFNTLNNIYSLSQFEPGLVSESIVRLSKLLRYILYEASTDFITIDKEIKILNDYIDLEKLRYSEQVSIQFTHDVEDFSEMIPPLLLLPLVENAFKHGVSQFKGARFVEVNFRVQKRRLSFTVSNSASTGDNNELQENIGLSNLRRRLHLLYKEFDFAIKKTDSVFIAELTINLESHV